MLSSPAHQVFATLGWNQNYPYALRWHFTVFLDRWDFYFNDVLQGFTERAPTWVGNRFYCGTRQSVAADKVFYAAGAGNNHFALWHKNNGQWIDNSYFLERRSSAYFYPIYFYID